jgi:hypothetical protein
MTMTTKQAAEFWAPIKPRLTALYVQQMSYPAMLATLNAEFGCFISKGQMSGAIHRLLARGELPRRDPVVMLEVRLEALAKSVRERAKARATRAPFARPQKPAVPKVARPGAGCMWPTWNPKGKGEAYWDSVCRGVPIQCDAPRAPDQVYCDRHRATATARRQNTSATPSKQRDGFLTAAPTGA